MTEAEARFVLSTTAQSTQDMIKRRYRLLAAQFHPDVEGGSRVAFEQIQAAYELLSGPSAEERQGRAVKIARLKLDLKDVKAKILVEEGRCKQYSPTDFRRKVLAGWVKKQAEIEQALADA